MASEDRTISLLRQIELFQDIEAADLRLIARQMSEQAYQADEVVFCEGDPGDRLFVILVGSMQVYVERDGEVITYTTMQPGECFGEMALLEDAPRSATVKATAPARCLTLSKPTFLTLIGQHPHVALVIMRELSRRLRHLGTLVQHRAGTREQ